MSISLCDSLMLNINIANFCFMPESLWQSVTPLIKRKDLVEGILLRRLFIWFRTLSRRNSCDSSLMILMIRKLHSTKLSHEL